MVCISKNLATLAGLEDFDMNVRSLPSDRFSFPYHYHRFAEELFIIIKGKVQVRTPEGITEAVAGDMLFFEVGPTGAHQLYNHTDAPCLYLDLCTNRGFDVCDYPDSNKISIINDREIRFAGERATYFEGEEAIRQVWSGLIQE